MTRLPPLKPLRAVFVPPTRTPSVVSLDNTAQAIHNLIGGFFEVFYVPRLTTDPMRSVIGLCDEDGWRNQPVLNQYSMFLHERNNIAGNVLLVRAHPSGEFVSLTREDIATIGRLLYVTLEVPLDGAYSPRGNDPTRRA